MINLMFGTFQAAFEHTRGSEQDEKNQNLIACGVREEELCQNLFETMTEKLRILRNENYHSYSTQKFYNEAFNTLAEAFARIETQRRNKVKLFEDMDANGNPFVMYLHRIEGNAFTIEVLPIVSIQIQYCSDSHPAPIETMKFLVEATGLDLIKQI